RRMAAAEAEAKGAWQIADEHDDAHLRVFTESAKVAYGELEQHRSNPYYHIANMDLACYDREYAAPHVRASARAEHLAPWPDAVDMAISSLDQVPAPVATALGSAVRGLAAGLPDDSDEQSRQAALAAHARLVDHIDHAAKHGRPDAA